MIGFPRLASFAALSAFFLVSAPAMAERRVGDPINLGDFPVTESGSFLSGRLATSLRDNEAAAKFLAEALQADPNNPDLVERTFSAFLSAGKMDQAMRYAERLIAIDPEHRFARMALGVRALRAKQYAAAREHFQKATQRPILDLIAPLLGVWAEVGANKAKAGVDTADKVTGETWYQVFKEFNAGLALEFAGDDAAAVTRLRAAVTLDPGAIRVTEALARALARSGKPDEAIKVLDDYLVRQPDNSIAIDLKADIAAKRGIERMPRSIGQGAAETLVALAVPLGRQNAQEVSIAFVQMALYLDPQNPVALIAAADLYTDMGQPQNAAEMLEKLPDTTPLKRNAEIALGQTLDQLDKTDEGVRHLQEIIKQDPKDYEAVVSLAGIFQGRKRFAEAAETYSKAIALVEKPERQHWGVFYYRGIAHERTKQWPKAEADFKKALELYPDQPDVLNYLGYSWIDQGINLDEGMAMIRKAVEQKPNSGYIVDSLGWAYFKIGDYDKAVEALEKAVQLRASDAVINDHLGDAYWRVGRKLEATFQWRHALDANPPPEPEEKVKIELKLKQGLTDGPKAAEVPKAGQGG